MAEKVDAEVNGLQISNATFSATPPGSMCVALNVVMPQKGVIEPVRGQARAYTPPAAAQIPFALTEFQGQLLANCATGKTSESYTLGYGANPIVTLAGGPWNPVDCDGSSTAYGRMKFGFAGSYIYFCTTEGPKCIESTTSYPPRTAGLDRMPDALAVVLSRSLATPPTNWLEYGCSVAYRTVMRQPTTDGVSLLSAPSGRVVVTNRLLALAGGLVRSGTTVTVTPSRLWAYSAGLTLGIAVGDTFTLTVVSPAVADAAFPEGVKTVTGVSSTAFTYTEAGAATSSTVDYDCDTGTRAVVITAFLPANRNTSDLVRIYRSDQTSDSSIEPSDELKLVYEMQLDGSQVTLGYASFTDITPQSVISDPLYTNPLTGEGPTQANNPPPTYRDTANWGERQWYANTTGLQTFNLQMLGVGSPDGVQNNDTITIDDGTTGYDFTFKTSAGGTPEVQIYSGGIPSENINITAQALVAAINTLFVTLDVGIRAYYSSSVDNAPGKIMLQAAPQLDTFTVEVSRKETWVPGFDDNTEVDSQAERVPNGFAYSKLEQAEAVPPLNYGTVGSKNYAIERIIPLQNALLFFKSGDGIYALTGSAPFQVQQISTANIVAPDACALFADAAWVYTDQGILRVSDAGGAVVVSRQIETELNRLRALYPDETHDYSFAVPYETERRIMFFVPTGLNTDSSPLLSAYCYCNATQAWTGPLYEEAYSGVVGPEANKLYLGIYDEAWATGRVTLERKTQTWEDYANASFSNSVTTLGSDTLTIELNSMTDVEAGDGLTQSGYGTKIVALRDDLGANWVEVAEVVPWTVAACTVYKHYDVEVQFQPSGAPTSRKTMTRLSWLFKPEWFANLFGLSTVMTDQVQAEHEIETVYGGFGLTPFGQGPFGNPTPLVVDVNPIKGAWASAAQFFLGFKLSEVWCKFRLQGFSALFETEHGPAGRGK